MIAASLRKKREKDAAQRKAAPSSNMLFAAQNQRNLQNRPTAKQYRPVQDKSIYKKEPTSKPVPEVQKRPSTGSAETTVDEKDSKSQFSQYRLKSVEASCIIITCLSLIGLLIGIILNSIIAIICCIVILTIAIVVLMVKCLYSKFKKDQKEDNQINVVIDESSVTIESSIQSPSEAESEGHQVLKSSTSDNGLEEMTEIVNDALEIEGSSPANQGGMAPIQASEI